jgi:hypothetical protein
VAGLAEGAFVVNVEFPGLDATDVFEAAEVVPDMIPEVELLPGIIFPETEVLPEGLVPDAVPEGLVQEPPLLRFCFAEQLLGLSFWASVAFQVCSYI